LLNVKPSLQLQSPELGEWFLLFDWSAEAQSGEAISLNRYLNLSNSHRCQPGKFFHWGNTPSLERGVSPN
jgi:hypothetical protein